MIEDLEQEKSIEQNLCYSDRDEAGLLGAILTGGRAAYNEASATISFDDFMDPRHKLIWRTIHDLASIGSEISTLTIIRSLEESGEASQAGGMAYIAELPDKGYGGSFVSEFAPAVLDLANRRRTIAMLSKALVSAQDRSNPVDDIVAKVEGELRKQKIGNVTTMGPRQAYTELVNDIQRRFDSQGKLQGIATGWIDFDSITDGLQAHEMTILGARPSIGKTAAILNVVEHAAIRNAIPTLVVSLEMRVASMERRMLSSYMQIPMGDLRSGRISEQDMRKFTSFLGYIGRAPIYWIEALNGITIDKLTATIRRMVAQHNIKLVAVDYLQKIKPSGKSEKRTYEVAEVSTGLKACANDTGAAFLVAAQLSRDGEKQGEEVDGLPSMKHLADSSQIERDADTIGLIHRNRAHREGEAKIVICKQRDGETGMVELYYRGQFCKFENQSKFHDQP